MVTYDIDVTEIVTHSQVDDNLKHTKS